MMTDKEKMAKQIDGDIARYQASYGELSEKAEAAEKAGDIAAFQKLRIEALNVRNDLQYWRDYKNRNPNLWRPDPEQEKLSSGSLSAKQIRLWLLDSGKLADVDETIAGFDSPLRERAQIEWQHGNYFERDSKFIKDLAGAMGWTDEWLNAEWEKAAAIE